MVARLSTTLCCRRVQIEEVRHLLALQCGVIARRHVLEAGGTDNDIQRLIRRRQWARVHEGVYVDHTGPLSPIQRDWAAVLYAWLARSGHAGQHARTHEEEDRKHQCWRSSAMTRTCAACS